MYGIVARAGALHRVDLPDPEPGPGEVAIRVGATAVNRADLAQRAGRYPPPAGASEVLGLECAGRVEAAGDGVSGLQVGDRVCALLSGGGYASRVVCPAAAVLPVPDGLPLAEAAALPEAACTVWMVLDEARAGSGDRVLWHAAASGVGTFGVQVCRALGWPVFATVGSTDKLVRCRALGADAGWVRGPEGFVAAVQEWSPEGVDVVVDPVGGAYVAWDQEVLRSNGRVVVLSFLGGRLATVDLGRLLMRGQRLLGTTLRSRPDADKARIVAGVAASYWPLVAAGDVGPVVQATLPLAEADAAHQRLASGDTVGKLVLIVDPELR